MTAEPQVSELPYPLAKRLRAEGKDDAAITAALLSTGLTLDDARFVIASLPGGALDTGASAPLSSDAGAGGSVPLSGIVMLGAGVVITLGSYAFAAPGGSYVVTWGLIAVGLMRILRGR